MDLSESQVIPEDREVEWVEEDSKSGCVPKDKEEEILEVEEEDSYDEEKDIYSEYKKYIRKLGDTEINLYTELRFARVVHKKACKGLEDDPPPEPITWLTNGKMLYERWEKFKVDQIGLIEHPDTPEDQKEQATIFLQCAVGVYMDFMCSVYELFFKPPPKEKVEEIKDDEELKDTEDELK